MQSSCELNRVDWGKGVENVVKDKAGAKSYRFFYNMVRTLAVSVSEMGSHW